MEIGIAKFGLSEKDTMRNLPPMFCDIARVTNLKTALLIAERLAGQQYYLPDNIERWELAELIGEEHALKLLDHFGGSRYIEFPAALGNTTMTRLKGIRMLECGASLSAVAGELKVSRSAVKAWKKTISGAGA